ncbi:MAG: HAD family hydrolase [Sphingobacteriaceae bacterium]
MNFPKAFLFDLNGTMIDDMQYHNDAWFYLLNDELKAGLTWEELKQQMYGKNNELLERVFGKGRFTKEEADRLSMEKEKRYQQAYLQHLKLVKGLPALLEKATEFDIRMAVSSAATPFNIDYVLDNLSIRHYFKAVVSADDVERSKPDPETFLKAARLLQVDSADCIVFEDAPKGVEAAENAQMKCIVLTTSHDKEDFKDYKNILYFIRNFEDQFLEQWFKD